MNKIIKFEDFLKNEFGLVSGGKMDLDMRDTYEIEEAKNAIGKKVHNLGSLSHTIEKTFPNSEKKDIEDKIEEAWILTFERIKYELHNLDHVLNNEPKKKSRKIYKAPAVNSGVVSHVWFSKVMVAGVLILFFSLSLGVLAPGVLDKVATQIEAIERNYDQYPEQRIYRKAGIDQTAMSEFIVNNQQELSKLQHGDSLEIVDIDDVNGIVAGEFEDNQAAGKKWSIKAIINSIIK